VQSVDDLCWLERADGRQTGSYDKLWQCHGREHGKHHLSLQSLKWLSTRRGKTIQSLRKDELSLIQLTSQGKIHEVSRLLRITEIFYLWLLKFLGNEFRHKLYA
jgi:hypothetical protein